jgi:hypothetical protein
MWWLGTALSWCLSSVTELRMTVTALTAGIDAGGSR